MPSVFLLDDHEIVRRGIAQLLETEDDICVVGEARHRRRARSPGALGRPAGTGRPSGI
ncbi:hypothetical protein GCM10023215_29100 [Pseudonocardia yuanmonensis]|uniref:Response regulatory domain-containing protein n=1 Tax=Pseudonocardia yuanmonensis TaxID=1095914 RepID=A0ABP8WJU7_9PSEU